MPTLFKYSSLSVLSLWILGVLFLKTDGVIHLFLVIGLYALVIGHASERALKNRKSEVAKPQLLLPAATTTVEAVEWKEVSDQDIMPQSTRLVAIAKKVHSATEMSRQTGHGLRDIIATETVSSLFHHHVKLLAQSKQCVAAPDAGSNFNPARLWLKWKQVYGALYASTSPIEDLFYIRLVQGYDLQPIGNQTIYSSTRTFRYNSHITPP